MEYKKLVKPSGVLSFRTETYMSLNDFRLLISRLASKFESRPEWIAMPEAEIGKICTKSAQIYAKLDFAYGFDLDCTGLSIYETLLVESVLANHNPGACSQ